MNVVFCGYGGAGGAEGSLAGLFARVLESESVNSPVVGRVTLTWCCPP